MGGNTGLCCLHWLRPGPVLCGRHLDQLCSPQAWGSAVPLPGEPGWPLVRDGNVVPAGAEGIWCAQRGGGRDRPVPQPAGWQDLPKPRPPVVSVGACGDTAVGQALGSSACAAPRCLGAFVAPGLFHMLGQWHSHSVGYSSGAALLGSPSICPFLSPRAQYDSARVCHCGEVQLTAQLQALHMCVVTHEYVDMWAHTHGSLHPYGHAHFLHVFSASWLLSAAVDICPIPLFFWGLCSP